MDIDIAEEYEGNKSTGIEVEESEPETVSHAPWDASKIRVDAKNFSLRNILDLIADKDIDLAPDFQRGNVWKPQQKCRLIESILLRIPLPAFYFSSSEEGTMQVVDGIQRLSAIRDFAGDEYPLESLEYLSGELEGKRFRDLTGTHWVRRFNNTQILANVIDPQTPDQVKFDIFKRINTGGSPLNAQEIRHCMSGNMSRDFLKECTSLASFTQATGGSLKNQVRMVDREVVLRFCAFRLFGVMEYGSNETIDAFLTRATKRLDKQASIAERDTLLDDLDRAMSNAYHIFGDHAFRKWPWPPRNWHGSEKINPLNRALFEIWSVALADYDWDSIAPYRTGIRDKARDMMTYDMEFVNAISSSTGDVQCIATRFSRVHNLLQDFLGGIAR